MAPSGKSKGNQVADGTFRPQEYISPFGDVVHNDGKTYLRPNIDQSQQDLMGLQNQKLLNYTKQLPDSFSVNDYYNNPFYDSTYSQLRRPIDTQYDIDKRDLSNNLNARNQTGGSYDALQNYYLGRRYDSQYADAADKARSASAQAYQQQYQNNLAGLDAVRADRTNLLNELNLPLQNWATVQQGVTGAKSQLANYTLGQQQLAAQRQQNQLNFLASIYGSAVNAAKPTP